MWFDMVMGSGVKDVGRLTGNDSMVEVVGMGMLAWRKI